MVLDWSSKHTFILNKRDTTNLEMKFLKVRHMSRSEFFYLGFSNFLSKLVFSKWRPTDQGKKNFGLDMCLTWRSLVSRSV